MDVYLERLEAVAASLAQLAPDFMLFGAGVLPLYLDRPATESEFRPTEDVDAYVPLTVVSSESTMAVAHFEEQLRSSGWRHDLRPHRNNQYAFLSPDDIAVDFVFASLLSTEDWVRIADGCSETRTLSSGTRLRVPTPQMWLVCKVEASRNPARWSGPYDSHDLEDIALLMSGASQLSQGLDRLPEVARSCLRAWARELGDSETDYARSAYACLEANWPRSSNVDRLEELLRVLEAGDLT